MSYILVLDHTFVKNFTCMDGVKGFKGSLAYLRHSIFRTRKNTSVPQIPLRYQTAHDDLGARGTGAYAHASAKPGSMHIANCNALSPCFLPWHCTCI